MRGLSAPDTNPLLPCFLHGPTQTPQVKPPRPSNTTRWQRAPRPCLLARLVSLRGPHVRQRPLNVASEAPAMRRLARQSGITLLCRLPLGTLSLSWLQPCAHCWRPSRDPEHEACSVVPRQPPAPPPGAFKGTEHALRICPQGDGRCSFKASPPGTSRALWPHSSNYS